MLAAVKEEGLALSWKTDSQPTTSIPKTHLENLQSIKGGPFSGYDDEIWELENRPRRVAGQIRRGTSGAAVLYVPRRRVQIIWRLHRLRIRLDISPSLPFILLLIAEKSYELRK